MHTRMSGRSTTNSNALKNKESLAWPDGPVRSSVAMCVARPATTKRKPVSAGNRRRFMRVLRKLSEKYVRHLWKQKPKRKSGMAVMTAQSSPNTTTATPDSAVSIAA